MSERCFLFLFLVLFKEYPSATLPGGKRISHCHIPPDAEKRRKAQGFVCKCMKAFTCHTQLRCQRFNLAPSLLLRKARPESAVRVGSGGGEKDDFPCTPFFTWFLRPQLRSFLLVPHLTKIFSPGSSQLAFHSDSSWIGRNRGLASLSAFLPIKELKDAGFLRGRH